MSNVMLLDGGIGQELMRRTPAAPTPLWSTQVMMDTPELLLDVHRDFFAAGATVVTTNTYAVLRDRGLEDVKALADRAVAAATTARDAAGHGLIAGSIGPLGASYRPDMCPPVEKAVELYQEPIANLLGKVDVLLFETMTSIAQVEGALRAAQTHSVPVWVALSVQDTDGTKLRSGEDIAAVAEVFDEVPPDAVLINCSPPERIGAALGTVAKFGLPFGAYANGFTRISDGFLTDAPTVYALEARTDLSPEAYAAYALEWVAKGATIVGGCCEVGPAHIAAIADALKAQGHHIV